MKTREIVDEGAYNENVERAIKRASGEREPFTVVCVKGQVRHPV
jgi:hypothetical protein